MKHFVKHLGKVPLRASSEFNGEGVEVNNGISCVTDLLAYMTVAMAGAAPGQTVADAWSGQGDVQEASAPAIRVRSADEHHPLLEKINSMLASSAGLAKSVRATHVERSNTDPSTIVARTNILGNNTALSIHTNGSHTSAVFTVISPVNRPALMPTDYDYFTFGGVDGIKMTAQVLNGTLAQSAYVEDLVHLTQADGRKPAGSLSSATAATPRYLYQLVKTVNVRHVCV
ncbi:hypothetical protein LTR01_009036 [Friedmanniomyces endolithicus]|nr:hypothetical protein LTR01_009036 [Friedmanniomyces endolithicus]KAK0822717.1 hypothetical protein LTR73_009096 [Friedmanniomyces endolithicus]